MMTSHNWTNSVFFTIAAIAILGFFNPAHGGSVRFLPLSEEVAGRTLGLQDGKELTTIKDLNTRKRSKVYACSSGDTPVSLVALDRQRPNGKPSGVEFIVPGEMKSPLILILADADEASGIRAMVVEDDNNAFPWGSFRFLNTTGNSYMVRYEKETTAVPAELKPLDIVPGGEARNMGLQIFSENDPDVILYSAVWEYDPNLRKLVIIMPGAEPNQDRLKIEIVPQDQRVQD